MEENPDFVEPGTELVVHILEQVVLAAEVGMVAEVPVVRIPGQELVRQ